MEDLFSKTLYFKIPNTTNYSADLALYFDESKCYIVIGEEFCEKDIYGNDCSCTYVSAIWDAVEDKCFLIDELVECGYHPNQEDFYSGKFARFVNGKFKTYER